MYKIENEIMNELKINYYHDLNKHLIYITKYFKKYEINYWLLYGTLLGAKRFGRLIHSDNEIDIGVDISDYDKIYSLNDEIKLDRYELKKIFGYGYNSKGDQKAVWKVFFKLLYNNYPVGDIIFFTKCEDDILRSVDPIHDINYWPSIRTIPSWFIEKFDKIKVENTYHNIPRDSDMLLNYWYGENWKTMKINDQVGDQDLEYTVYSNDKRSLNYLIKYVMENTDKILTPKYNLYEYTFPENQNKWLELNDPHIKSLINDDNSKNNINVINSEEN